MNTKCMCETLRINFFSPSSYVITLFQISEKNAQVLKQFTKICQIEKVHCFETLAFFVDFSINFLLTGDRSNVIGKK